LTCLILAVLALFVLQTLLPASFRYLLAGPGTARRLKIALGPRDTQPPMPPMGARAERALANLHEALPVFLTLALLHVFQGSEHALGPVDIHSSVASQTNDAPKVTIEA
jgi:uncharacterized MAPEG superfamily protein